jgi:RNA polymerase II elongation factor ELL
MNSLKIPDHGLMLKGSAGRDIGPLPPQAFALSLNDSVIEGMIKCVQGGGDIQLALGPRPVSLCFIANVPSRLPVHFVA